MPELPEVETIKRDLVPRLVGRTIKGIHFTWPKAVKETSPEAMEEGVVGRRVMDVGRRGKYLLIRLDNGKTLVIHLKMSGSLLLVEGECELSDPYVRTVLYLDNGCLAFRDLRKFGSLWLVEDEERFFRHLGPEPLEKEFTASVFEALLRRRGAPIKAVLLDQSVIAGVGNMYADEALFEARIHPLKKSSDLTPEEVRRLHRAIRKVLRKGIELGGASVSTYQRPDGSKGFSHEQFQVAHRHGSPCPCCGATLEYLKIRSRGTTLCPRCQG